MMIKAVERYYGWEISRIVLAEDILSLVLEAPMEGLGDQMPVVMHFSGVDDFEVSYSLISRDAIIERVTSGSEEIESLGMLIKEASIRDGKLTMICDAPTCFESQMVIKATDLDLRDLAGQSIATSVVIS